MLIRRLYVFKPVQKWKPWRPKRASSTVAENTNAQPKSSQSPPVDNRPMVQRWKDFWINVYKDYKDVAKDLIQESRDKPKKTAFYLTTLAAIVYCNHTRPSGPDYLEQVTHCRNDLIQVHENLQRPSTKAYIKHLSTLINDDMISCLNLGVCSLIVRNECNNDCKLYEYTNTHLRVDRLTKNWTDRIVDIGVFRRWWHLEQNMIDYDVNFND